jgi:alkylation response protein AidB-like acyl-CoA dehydrogenase
VNLELDDEQKLLQQACSALFTRHAGPARARLLTESGQCDHELVRHLGAAGMLDIASDPSGGPLGAALVTEWAAEAAACAPIGWRAMVAPQVIEGAIPDVVVVVDNPAGLTRFGCDADAVLSVRDGHAVLSDPDQWHAEPAGAQYGFPLSRVEIRGGRDLGPEAASAIRRWSQVVVAAEIAGAARSALMLTVRYVKDRHQFGRSLGSYQAIQHRLAEVLMLVEGSSLLAKDAAFRGAPDESAALAATFATDCAQRIVTDLHQFTGAIGFAKEYDLYLWTRRLNYLALEAGGIDGHARSLYDSRWRPEAVSA